jgi:ATP-dependent DNA helicase RecG
VQPERFIDGYGCRNEPLAKLMRRFNFCEEQGSGFDKVVRAVEEYYLPAPEVRFDSIRTTCILHGPREFAEMTYTDRIRACYQHCCLRYIERRPMTNQSLRERFRLEETRSVQTQVFKVIAAAQATGRIKVDKSMRGSKRYARYLPFWA